MKKSLTLTFILILSLGWLLGYSTNKIICAKKLHIMQQENELLKKKLQIANKNLSNKNNKNFSNVVSNTEIFLIWNSFSKLAIFFCSFLFTFIPLLILPV